MPNHNDDKATTFPEARGRAIIKHISDAAIELAFMRHSFAEEDEPDIEAIKSDTFACLTGDETGCLLPEELDETNCVLLWFQRRASVAVDDLIPPA